MYLARLAMDVMAPGARRDLRNCHELHRTVMAAYGDMDRQEARRHFNVLYRLAPSGGSMHILYVQSQTAPEVGKWLEKGYLSPLQAGRVLLEISAPEVFSRAGMLLNFDLLACPTKTVSTSTKQERLQECRRNGHRVLLGTEMERLGWLARKAETGGFELLEVWESGKYSTFGYHKPEKGGKMVHAGVRFQGTLRIANPVQFAETMRCGIGPGKAYGYGLLMVKRCSF